MRCPIKQAPKSFVILLVQVSRDIKSITAGPVGLENRPGQPNPRNLCVFELFWVGAGRDGL